MTRAALCAGRGTAFRLVHAKAASRGIPLAAALQICSPELRSVGKVRATDEQTLVPPGGSKNIEPETQKRCVIRYSFFVSPSRLNILTGQFAVAQDLSQ